ncbi:MAG TPA: hypothetical protein VM287_15110, partial [Egibacteraceae bacterium]|nr:hypothetical protein [Egibacteraceae bacterium]
RRLPGVPVELRAVCASRRERAERFAAEHGVARAVADLDAVLADADLIIVLQPHREYLQADVAAKAALLLDTRGVLHGENVHRL